MIDDKFVCITCKESYETLEGNFHKNRATVTGYCSDCCECRNERNKISRDSRFESVLKFEALQRRSYRTKHNITNELAEKYFKAVNSIKSKNKIVETLTFSDMKLFVKQKNY